MISDTAFAMCSSLPSINIPNSVTTIGTSAFAGCESLKEITIPDSVTSLGSTVFSDCTSLQKANINANVLRLATGFFQKCTSLTEINISKNITTIGQQAFYKCTSLTSINLQENIQAIERAAFASCTSLSKVNIYNSSIELGEIIFYGCNENLVIGCYTNSTVCTYADDNELTYELFYSRINIDNLPTNETYYIGESLDTTGIVVLAEDDKGGKFDVTKECTIDDIVFEYAGNETITVRYKDVKTTFSVTVKEPEQEKIVFKISTVNKRKQIQPGVMLKITCDEVEDYLEIVTSDDSGNITLSNFNVSSEGKYSFRIVQLDNVTKENMQRAEIGFYLNYVRDVGKYLLQGNNLLFDVDGGYKLIYGMNVEQNNENTTMVTIKMKTQDAMKPEDIFLNAVSKDNRIQDVEGAEYEVTINLYNSSKELIDTKVISNLITRKNGLVEINDIVIPYRAEMIIEQTTSADGYKIDNNKYTVFLERQDEDNILETNTTLTSLPNPDSNIIINKRKTVKIILENESVYDDTGSTNQYNFIIKNYIENTNIEVKELEYQVTIDEEDQYGNQSNVLTPKTKTYSAMSRVRIPSNGIGKIKIDYKLSDTQSIDKYRGINTDEVYIEFSRIYNADDEKFEYTLDKVPDNLEIEIKEESNEIIVIEKVRSNLKFNIKNLDINTNQFLSGAQFTIDIKKEYTDGTIKNENTITTDEILEAKNGVSILLEDHSPYNKETYTIKQIKRTLGYEQQPPTLEDIILEIYFDSKAEIERCVVIQGNNYIEFSASDGYEIDLNVFSGIKTSGYTFKIKNIVNNIENMEVTGLKYSVRFEESNLEDNTMPWETPQDDTETLQTEISRSRLGKGSIKITYSIVSDTNEYEAIDRQEKTITFDRTYNESTEKYEFTNKNTSDNVEIIWDDENQIITVTEKVKTIFTLNLYAKDINANNKYLEGAEFTIDATRILETGDVEDFDQVVTNPTNDKGLTTAVYKQIEPYSIVEFTIKETKRVYGYEQPEELEDINLTVEFDENGRIKKKTINSDEADYAYFLNNANAGPFTISIMTEQGLKNKGYTFSILNRGSQNSNYNVSGLEYKVRFKESDIEGNTLHRMQPQDDTIILGTSGSKYRLGKGDITITYSLYRNASEYEAIDTQEKTISFTRTYNNDTEKYEWSNKQNSEGVQVYWDEENQKVYVVELVTSIFNLDLHAYGINGGENVSGVGFSVTAQKNNVDDGEIEDLGTMNTTTTDRNGNTGLKYRNVEANAKITFTIKEIARSPKYPNLTSSQDIILIVEFGADANVKKSYLTSGNAYSYVYWSKGLTTQINVAQGVREGGFYLYIENRIQDIGSVISAGTNNYTVNIYSTDVETNKSGTPRPRSITRRPGNSELVDSNQKGDITVTYTPRAKRQNEDNNYPVKHTETRAVKFSRIYNENTRRYEFKTISVPSDTELVFDPVNQRVVIREKVYKKYTIRLLTTTPQNPYLNITDNSGTINTNTINGCKYRFVGERQLSDGTIQSLGTIDSKVVRHNEYDRKWECLDIEIFSAYPNSTAKYTINQIKNNASYEPIQEIKLNIRFNSSGNISSINIISGGKYANLQKYYKNIDGTNPENASMVNLTNQINYNQYFEMYMMNALTATGGYSFELKNVVENSQTKEVEGLTYDLQIVEEQQEKSTSAVEKTSNYNAITNYSIRNFGTKSITIKYKLKSDTNDYEGIERDWKTITFSRNFYRDLNGYKFEDISYTDGMQIEFDEGNQKIIVVEKVLSKFKLNIFAKDINSETYHQGVTYNIQGVRTLNNVVSESENIESRDLTTNEKGLAQSLYKPSIPKSIEYYTIKQTSPFLGSEEGHTEDDIKLVVEYTDGGTIKTARIVQGSGYAKITNNVEDTLTVNLVVENGIKAVRISV